MTISKVRLKKIVPLNDRYNAEFELAYKDASLGQEYFSSIIIGIPLNPELTYAEISTYAFDKLCDVVRSWSTISDDVVFDLIETA
ncbi:hypothetical protein AB4Y96_09355 [Phyllobacterium sp. TAF24]|uniref:hypothetical protein n=1 Tax=Phyllobacterium sp. TAF24 TaxID=3233068 RepID=UPI003F9C70AE